MIKRLLFLMIVLSSKVFGQTIENYYQNGFDKLKEGKYQEAKFDFIKLIELQPEDYGGYNFYGVCLFNERKYDSCIIYLKKSLELNVANNKHGREMTASRLIRTYIYLAKFEEAFNLAYQYSKDFPENPNLKSDLKDVCLWSYYITNEGLNKEYLSNELKQEYTVTNVPQEYLIMRNIKVNDKNLYLKKQGFNIEKKQDYLTCGINKTEDSVKITFNLNWDVTKEFGGKSYDSKSVYKDMNRPIYERIGALLVDDKKFDLISEIEKIQN